MIEIKREDVTPDDELTHIVPSRERHIDQNYLLFPKGCPCIPKYERCECCNEVLVIHNAFDNREFDEIASEINAEGTSL